MFDIAYRWKEYIKTLNCAYIIIIIDNFWECARVSPCPGGYVLWEYGGIYSWEMGTTALLENLSKLNVTKFSTISLYTKPFMTSHSAWK